MRAGELSILVAAAVAALAMLVPAGQSATPGWSRCPGTIAVGGRTFAVGVNGDVACPFARKAVPALQRTIAARVATPGRTVYFRGPTGWKCLAVSEPPAAREMSGYCALGIKSFEDPKARAAFTWLTPKLAKARLGR